MSKISLNNTESKIRDLLVEYSNHYNSQHTDPLVLRITGGWVRDKLLNRVSHDIDIAINNLSGEDFATRLNEYISANKGEIYKASSIHTIKKNPDKSKHLETCTTKLFGLDLDFVNLRSEAYAEDSRIPTIKYGTPQEDAMRRDATLNALFYNLNEDKIEDFTGKGLDDLRNGILRTPLQPLQTFLDDPLRALRLIRFASRLNYIIEDKSLEAMQTEQVKSALLNKISRERVGTEIEKTLDSGNPGYGLQLLNYAGLSNTIFNSKELIEALPKLGNSEALGAIEIASAEVETTIVNATYLYPIFEKVINEKDNLIKSAFIKVNNDVELKRAFWLATALYSYGNIMINSNPKKLHSSVHVAEPLLREGLKSSKNDIHKVSRLLKFRNESNTVFTDLTRAEFGLYLQQFGDFVELNILFNLFIDCLSPVAELVLLNYKPTPTLTYEIEFEAKLSDFVRDNILKYEFLSQSIIDKGLVNVHDMKLIIDGKTLIKELKLKAGPWVGLVNSEILVWQLNHPEGTKEACMDFIREILPKYID